MGTWQGDRVDFLTNGGRYDTHLWCGRNRCRDQYIGGAKVLQKPDVVISDARDRKVR